MDKLDQYRIFIQVAEQGSFIKAAHNLNLPRASVSAAIQQLESKIGTRLLHRTTRTVGLTSDGAQLLERARQLLTDANNIDQMFQTHLHQVTGRLCVDTPSRIARRLIVPALPEFLRRHPRLQLSLSSSDKFINLVQESVDCAVRVGRIHDSSLVVRPLGHLVLINCASSHYLREQGTPQHPEELTDHHQCVGYSSPTTGRELPWEYVANRQQYTRAIASRVSVNNVENYIAGAVAGLGLIQIPRFDVEHLLASGELTEIMPQFRPAPMPIAIVYPHRRQHSQRLSAFIKWFEQLIKPHLNL